MIKNLLFDLDGTLLPIDLDFFMLHYINAVASIFPSTPREKFSEILMASTMKMVKNLDHSLTNEEVFWDDFVKRIGISRSDLEPIFLRFYSEEFPKLQKHLTPTATPRRVLDCAVQHGFSLVLATNPIFPAQAIKERLAWINCQTAPFKLITAFEDMHFCKPNPEYYKEVVDLLQVDPEECLMIGNDMEEDLVASYLGMKTCLITDFLISRGQIQVEPDYQCTLEELPVILKELSPANGQEGNLLGF